VEEETGQKRDGKTKIEGKGRKKKQRKIKQAIWSV
jgi:hypothetical protein